MVSSTTTSEDRLRLLTSLIAPWRNTSMNLSLVQIEDRCVSVRYRVPLARDFGIASRSAAMIPITSLVLTNLQAGSGGGGGAATATTGDPEGGPARGGTRGGGGASAVCSGGGSATGAS